jgi:hypothetical protein
MSKDKRWHKLESGQALMEYWPTIPAAIMIIISAGLIVNFLRGSFSDTADALNRVSDEICETSEDKTGPDSQVVDRHLFELVSVTYDGTNTTVVYQVTSAEKWSLSHWTLGISKDIADNIIDESEAWGWTDNDPKTGAVGIKFDIGYEGGGDSEETEEGEGGGPDPDKEKGPDPDKEKGPKKLRPLSRQIMNIQFQTEETTTTISIADGEAREIRLLLSGEYDFEPVTVTTKSANDNGVTGTVSGPVRIIIDEGTKDCNDE